MKINSATRFPHPILSRDTEDYVGGEYVMEFEVEEDTVTNSLKLQYSVDLVSDYILGLLDDNKISLGVNIRCLETYYNRVHEIKLAGSHLEFGPGILYGRVAIRPLIWASQDLSSFVSDSLHEEYHGQSFEIAAGLPLGWDAERVVSVGRHKLAPIESIFIISKNEDLDDSQFLVDPQNNKIEIHVGKSAYMHINMLRQTGRGQAVLINSVYLPAIMQVLDYLKASENYTEYSWYKIFKAKCDFCEVSFDGNILQNAQRLLNLPYKRLEESFDE